MSKQGCQVFGQWPQTLQVVDVETGGRVYRPNKDADLPALIDSEVLSSCDPRLSTQISSSSIYFAKPASFAVELAHASQRQDNPKAANHNEEAPKGTSEGRVINNSSMQIMQSAATGGNKSDGELSDDDDIENTRRSTSSKGIPVHSYRHAESKNMTRSSLKKRRPRKQSSAEPSDDHYSELPRGIKRKRSGGDFSNHHSLAERPQKRQPLALRQHVTTSEVRPARRIKLHHRGASSLCRLKELTPYVEFIPNYDDPLLHITFCELEDLCAIQRQDFLSDLNSVYIGKKPRFLYGMGREKLMKHLETLSPSTQMNGYFITSDSVSRVHMKVLCEWMQDKALDKMSCALRYSVPCDVPRADQPVPVVDHMNEAFCSWLSKQLTQLYVISSGDIELCYDIFIGSSVSYHDTTNHVFRQVKQYLEFLQANSNVKSNRLMPKTTSTAQATAGIQSKQLTKVTDQPSIDAIENMEIKDPQSTNELAEKLKAKVKTSDDFVEKLKAKIKPSDEFVNKFKTQAKASEDVVQQVSKLSHVKNIKSDITVAKVDEHSKQSPALPIIVPDSESETVGQSKAFVSKLATCVVSPVGRRDRSAAEMAKTTSLVYLDSSEDTDSTSKADALSDETTKNASSNFIFKPNRVSVKHLRNSKKKRSHRYKSRSSKVKHKSSRRHDNKKSVKSKSKLTKSKSSATKSRITRSLESDVSDISVEDVRCSTRFVASDKNDAIVVKSKVRSAVTDLSNNVKKKKQQIGVLCEQSSSIGIGVITVADQSCANDDTSKNVLISENSAVDAEVDLVAGDTVESLFSDLSSRAILLDEPEISTTVTIATAPDDDKAESVLVSSDAVSSEVSDHTDSLYGGLPQPSVAAICVGSVIVPDMSKKEAVLDEVDDSNEIEEGEVNDDDSFEVILSDDEVDQQPVAASVDDPFEQDIKNYEECPVKINELADDSCDIMVDLNKPLDESVRQSLVGNYGDSSKSSDEMEFSLRDDLEAITLDRSERPTGKRLIDHELDEVLSPLSKKVKQDTPSLVDISLCSSKTSDVINADLSPLIHVSMPTSPVPHKDLRTSLPNLNTIESAGTAASLNSPSNDCAKDTSFALDLPDDNSAQKLKLVEQLKHMAATKGIPDYVGVEDEMPDESSSEDEAEFIPDYDLYQDSFESLISDPYNTVPAVNFVPNFDPTQAPVGHQTNPFKSSWPVLDAFVKGDIETLKSFGSIPDASAFNVHAVARNTSFLWALVLSVYNQKDVSDQTSVDGISLDSLIPQTSSLDAAVADSLKGRAAKASNPLMQAFRQAVEAKRKIALKPKLGSLKLSSSGASVKPTLPGRMPIVFGNNLKTGGSLSAIVGPLQQTGESNSRKLMNVVSSAVDVFHSDLESQFGLLPSDCGISGVYDLLKEGRSLHMRHLRDVSNVVVHLYDTSESAKLISSVESESKERGSSPAEMNLEPKPTSSVLPSIPATDSVSSEIVSNIVSAEPATSVSENTTANVSSVTATSSTLKKWKPADDFTVGAHKDNKIVAKPAGSARTKSKLTSGGDGLGQSVSDIKVPPNEPTHATTVSSGQLGSVAVEAAVSSVTLSMGTASSTTTSFADLLPPPMPPMFLSDFSSISSISSLSLSQETSSKQPDAVPVSISSSSNIQTTWSTTSTSLFTCPLDQLVQFPPPSVQFPPPPVVQSVVPPPSVSAPCIPPPSALPTIIPTPSVPPPTLIGVSVPPPAIVQPSMQFPPPAVPLSNAYFPPSSFPMPTVNPMSVPPPNYTDQSMLPPTVPPPSWMTSLTDNQNNSHWAPTTSVSTLHPGAPTPWNADYQSSHQWDSSISASPSVDSLTGMTSILADTQDSNQWASASSIPQAWSSSTSAGQASHLWGSPSVSTSSSESPQAWTSTSSSVIQQSKQWTSMATSQTCNQDSVTLVSSENKKTLHEVNSSSEMTVPPWSHLVTMKNTSSMNANHSASQPSSNKTSMQQPAVTSSFGGPSGSVSSSKEMGVTPAWATSIDRPIGQIAPSLGMATREIVVSSSPITPLRGPADTSGPRASATPLRGPSPMLGATLPVGGFEGPSSQTSSITGRLATSGQNTPLRGPTVTSGQNTPMRGLTVTSGQNTPVRGLMVGSDKITPVRGSAVGIGPVTALRGPAVTSSLTPFRGPTPSASGQTTPLRGPTVASGQNSVRGPTASLRQTAPVRGAVATSGQTTPLRGLALTPSQCASLRGPVMTTTHTGTSVVPSASVAGGFSRLPVSSILNTSPSTTKATAIFPITSASVTGSPIPTQRVLLLRPTTLNSMSVSANSVLMSSSHLLATSLPGSQLAASQVRPSSVSANLTTAQTATSKPLAAVSDQTWRTSGSKFVDTQKFPAVPVPLLLHPPGGQLNKTGVRQSVVPLMDIARPGAPPGFNSMLRPTVQLRERLMTPGVGGVPQPVMAPLKTPVHCKPTPSFTVLTPNCKSRVFVFNAHNLPVCKEVQNSLLLKGAKLFDPYNIAALCCIEKMECRILIHSGSLNAVHRLPNLLRLKRHLVVTFIAYDRLVDVASNDVSVIFPRAGLMVLETTMLLSCQSAILDTVCQYVQVQSTTKGARWRMVLANDIFTKLETLRDQCGDNVMEDVRLTEISQILETYQAQGFIELLPADISDGRPKNTLGYWSACVALQAKHCYQHRHFLFVSDMPRTQPDAKLFLDSGIDVMNIAEFLRGFMAKTIEHRPQPSPLILSAAALRLTPSKYVDARLSLSNDILNV